MEDRRRMMAIVTIMLGIVLFVFLVIGVLLSRSSLVSPIPDESSIKIIFITPTPTPLNSSSSSPTPSLATFP